MSESLLTKFPFGKKKSRNERLNNNKARHPRGIYLVKHTQTQTHIHTPTNNNI